MARGIWTSDSERSEILHLRQTGMSVAAIAKNMNRSINFVYRILKKANDSVQKPSTKLKPAAAVAETTTTVAMGVTSLSAPIAVAKSTKAEDRDDPLFEQPTTSSSSAALQGAIENRKKQESVSTLALTCACESLELQEHSQVQQSGPGITVDADGCFCSVRLADIHSSSAKSHRSEATDDVCMRTGAPFVNYCAPNISSELSTALGTVGRSTHNQVQTQLTRQPFKRQKKSSASSREPLRTNAQVVSTSASSSLRVNLQPQRPQATKNIPGSSSTSIHEILTRIQDEIKRLEHSAQSDVYDAQLLQMFIRFHAEVQLMQLRRTFSDGVSSKRARVEETDCTATNRLLREKLAREIALLDVQANRERLELEREWIRHKTASVICRKTLLNANTSQAEVDKLFSHQ